MKIVAINSSARVRSGESKTELLLNHLVMGMQQAGAEVETIYLKEKIIKDCICCGYCQSQTLGECILKDDMSKELLPKWLTSDLAVYATPIYLRFMNALMKRFLERTFPIYDLFTVRQNKAIPSLRYKLPLAVMFSVCTLPSNDEFKVLSDYANQIFGMRKLLIAEIYRHSAFLISSESDQLYKNKINDILDATVRAGKELIEFGRIFPETMIRITQPIDKPEIIIEKLNLMGEFYKHKNIASSKENVWNDIRPLHLEEFSDNRQWEILISHIGMILSKILGKISFETIDLAQGFFDMGMDYAMCINLQKSLEKSLNCKLPDTLTFKYPTINKLARYLAQDVLYIEIPSEFSHNLQTNVKRTNIEDDVNQMSETEAENALLRELEKINSDGC